MSVDVKPPPAVRRPVGAGGRAEIGPLVVRGDIDRLAAQLTALGHTNATVEARALVDAFWRAAPTPAPKQDLDSIGGRKMVAGAFVHAAGRTVVGRLVVKPHGDAHLKALRKVARTTADPVLRRLLMQTGMRALPDVLHPVDAPAGLVTGKLTRVGDSLGISPGGVFVDESGARFYAKRSVVGGERHLREELATVRFYEAAGANVIHQHLVTDADGAPFLLSRMIALHDISLDDAAQHPGMRAHFALDALLANWDVIGATSVHNVAKDAEGNLVRTEGGAGMRLSGLGDDDHFTAGFKFGAEVIDLDSLRTPTYSRLGSVAFRNVTNSEIRAQVADIARIFTPARIAELIDSAGIVDPDRSFLVNRLAERVGSMQRYVAALPAA